MAQGMGREGFDNIEPDKLEELIASHREELTEEDSESIIKVSKEESSEEEEEVVRSNLTVNFLAKVLQSME